MATAIIGKKIENQSIFDQGNESKHNITLILANIWLFSKKQSSKTRP